MRSLSLPSRPSSLLRPSSLALVSPWCSLSGAVGSLPCGASPLGGVRCGVGALRARRRRRAVCSLFPVRIRCAVWTESGGAPPSLVNGSPLLRRPRLLVSRTSQRAALSSRQLCAARSAARKWSALVVSGPTWDLRAPGLGTACVGAGWGVVLRCRRGVGPAARAPCFATLRVCSNSVHRNASRPRPLHGVSIHSASSMDRCSIGSLSG